MRLSKKLLPKKIPRMNKIIDECRSIYKASSFAQENLSFHETLSYLSEWQGKSYDPMILPCLTDFERKVILDSFRRVCEGYPLGYVVGKVWFYKSLFSVREGILIPRCDSEVLVETAVKLIPRQTHFLDLCTGSGCIGLSVLLERSDLTATLVDISDTALTVARENAQALGVFDRCRFLKKDLLSDLPKLPEHSAIVMNPPYLTSDEMKNIPENVRFEPSLALDGGTDGLVFYRLFEKSDKLMIFEIGSGQTDGLFSIYKRGRVVCDLSRNPRVFIINE